MNHDPDDLRRRAREIEAERQPDLDEVRRRARQRQWDEEIRPHVEDHRERQQRAEERRRFFESGQYVRDLCDSCLSNLANDGGDTHQLYGQLRGCCGAPSAKHLTRAEAVEQARREQARREQPDQVAADGGVQSNATFAAAGGVPDSWLWAALAAVAYAVFRR